MNELSLIFDKIIKRDMGSFSKWLGAGLGFTLGGPIGAAVGFALGSFVDGFSAEDLTKEQQYRQGGRGNTHPGDFEISLLVLASIIIKADGKVDPKELDFVRAQFVGMYGKEKANNAFLLFKGVMKKANFGTASLYTNKTTHASRFPFTIASLLVWYCKGRRAGSRS